VAAGHARPYRKWPGTTDQEVGGVRRRPTTGPVLITTAPPSRSEEHAGRVRQYTLVMATRVICFILAVVVQITWLRVVFIIGALVLPWVAVLAANQVHGKLPKPAKPYVPQPRPALTEGEEPEPRRADRRS
jgi:Flp pilus assembly protein TadB